MGGWVVFLFAVTIKLAVMHNSYSRWNVFVLVLSVSFYIMIVGIYASLLEFAPDAFGTFVPVFSSGNWWFALMLACSLALLPDFTYRFVARQLWPTARIIIQVWRGCDGDVM